LPASIAFTQLSFKTNLKNKSVDLNVNTNGAQIPVTVSVLNAQGKIFWKEEFTAPFQKQLSDTFNEAVASMSINGPDDKISLCVANKKWRLGNTRIDPDQIDHSTSNRNDTKTEA
jgi:hypothetical protein